MTHLGFLGIGICLGVLVLMQNISETKRSSGFCLMGT